jgi:hypothetical protein
MGFVCFSVSDLLSICTPQPFCHFVDSFLLPPPSLSLGFFSSSSFLSLCVYLFFSSLQGFKQQAATLFGFFSFFFSLLSIFIIFLSSRKPLWILFFSHSLCLFILFLSLRLQALAISHYGFFSSLFPSVYLFFSFPSRSQATSNEHLYNAIIGSLEQMETENVFGQIRINRDHLIILFSLSKIDVTFKIIIEFEMNHC